MEIEMKKTKKTKKAMKKAPAKKVAKKPVAKKTTKKSKTVKPSKALKKAVTTGAVELPIEVKEAVSTDQAVPVAETPKKKPGPAEVKATGKAVNKGGAVVFEAEQDQDDAPKGKTVVMRPGGATLVDDSEE
jgi:hypothetical protein